MRWMKTASNLLLRERRRLTAFFMSAMINILDRRNKVIEVACFKSNFSDVSGTGEDEGKGNAPKDKISVSILSWACIEEVYDCHLIMDGALS